jgi:hypothetical protein
MFPVVHAWLQRLLVDTGFAHADVRLHGFYAYASLDLGDITTFPGAMCGAVLSRVRERVLLSVRPSIMAARQDAATYQLHQLHQLACTPGIAFTQTVVL